MTANAPPPRGRVRAALFALASLFLAAPLLAGFLGALHPALDSFAHFRAHLAASAALLAVLGVLVAGRRVHLPALALLLLAAAAGATVGPYLLPLGRGGADAAGERSYTLLQMNLLAPADQRPAAALIRDTAPDVVTLQEIRRGFMEELARVGVSYPHVALCRPHGPRLAILSRHPFVDGGGICLAAHGFLSRQVRLGDTAVTVVSQHLRWPWPFSQWYHLRNIAPALRGKEPPVVVGGDFNAAPWSAAVGAFAALSGTHPVRGIGATWLHPALPEALRPWVGLPIDHVLVSDGVRVIDVRRLPPTRSDHLPVLARFTIARGG